MNMLLSNPVVCMASGNDRRQPPNNTYRCRVKLLEKTLQEKIELAVARCPPSKPGQIRPMSTECRVMWDEVEEITDALHGMRWRMDRYDIDT